MKTGGQMTEKLSMKRLADDIEAIRKRIATLEKAAPSDEIEAIRKRITALEKAPPPEKPKAKTGATRKELNADQRSALVEALAHFKAARRAQTGRAGDAESDWLEAEAEVALLLSGVSAEKSK